MKIIASEKRKASKDIAECVDAVVLLITISLTTLSRSTIEHFQTVLGLTTCSLIAMCDRLTLRSRDSTRHVCEGPGTELSNLRDTLTCHPSPKIRPVG
jgi:hypothetical protein